MTILTKAEDARTQAAKIKVNDKTSNTALAAVKADINAIIAEAKPTPPPVEPPPVEPPPVKPPVEPPVTEKPLFSGAEISDFAENQSAPGAVKEVLDPLGSGETVLAMTVSNSDVAPVTPTDNPRAQLVGPSDLTVGGEYWMAGKFLVPTSFPTFPKGWLSLCSFYGPPFEGSGPWGITAYGGPETIQFGRNGNYAWDQPFVEPLRKGVWIEWMVHFKLAKEGFVEMWIDGKPVTFFAAGTYNPNKVKPTAHLAMQTADSSNNGGPNSLRIMQYRELNMIKSTATLYHGAVRIGATRASVGG